MARGKVAATAFAKATAVKKSAKAMKPSGVAWLGDIPEGWEILPARHLFAEVTAKNKNGKYTRQLSFRYGEIVDKGPNQSHNAFPEETILTYTVVEPNTIMINGLNLNYDLLSLRVAIVKEVGIITSAYLAVVPQRSRIIPWYALYLLKAYDFKMVFHGQGSGIRMTLKFADFATLPIVLPPLPEQRAIADYLDEKCGAIDAAIAEAKRGIEEYKAWKKSLIFEAVTGKIAAGGSRSCATVSATTDALERVPPARPMRPSGIPWLGAVPQEWEMKKIKHCLSETFSGIWGDEIGKEKDVVICYRIADFDFFKGILSDAKLTRRSYRSDELKGKLVEKGDLLVEKSGGGDLNPVGRAIIVQYDIQATCSNFIQVLRCNPQHNSQFVGYVLRALYFKGVNGLYYNQTIGIQNLQVGKYLAIAIPLPPLAEQRAIAGYLDKKCAAIDAMVDEKEALIADLEAYKKSLIYETVTGKGECPNE